MDTQEVLDFTVSDLLRGGDDLVQLVTATGEPDRLWDEVGRRPRRRLTAALVAAIGAIQGEDADEVSDSHGHYPAATGHRPADR